jgi:hypothetical protein
MVVYEIYYEWDRYERGISYGFYSDKGLAEHILKQLKKYDDSPYRDYYIVEHEVYDTIPEKVSNVIARCKHEYEMMMEED